MKKFLFLLITILTIIGSSSVFANEIDLSYEKETYIDISNYYNTYSAKFRTSYVKPAYMTETFIDNLFSDLENRLPTITQYSQTQQPYMAIFFDGNSSFKVYFCSNVSISGATLKYKQNNNTFYLQYSFSDNILSYSNINIYSSSSTSDYTLSTLGGRNGDVIQCLLLSNYNKEFYTSQNYPPYASRTMFAETYIAETLMQFNPTLEYNNNLLLNIDVITGYDIIYDYDIFYYNSDNEEVSVKDYVSYNDTTTWFGNIRAFYIKNSNILQFSNDTDFYINVIYKPKLSSSNSISNNTMLAFKTLSSITNPDIGDDTGGGNTGGDTGGTTVDLGNIENSLGEINTTIIEVGTQTNQNLDEIEQAIKDVNESITSEPVYDENGELAEDQPGLVGKILTGLLRLFIPEAEFFGEYFDELLNWFSERLGLLAFPFEFVIDFFTRIYSADFSDAVIHIPDLYIPLFEDAGPILEAVDFNFHEFVNSDENLMYIYNMYLIGVDGIIIWGIITLLMKKYEEVMTK